MGEAKHLSTSNLVHKLITATRSLYGRPINRGHGQSHETNFKLLVLYTLYSCNGRMRFKFGVQMVGLIDSIPWPGVCLTYAYPTLCYEGTRGGTQSEGKSINNAIQRCVFKS